MKHTICLSVFAGLALAVLSFSACECEDLSPLVTDNTPNTFRVSSTSSSIDQPDTYVSFNFNQPIDTFSIKIGKTVLVEGMSTVSVFYSSNYFIVSGPGTQCNSDSTRCRVKITLKGSGADVVKSTGGQTLDGDADGSKGGDFVFEAEVQ